MPRAESSPAEDRGNTVAIIERLHLAGWLGSFWDGARRTF